MKGGPYFEKVTHCGNAFKTPIYLGPTSFYYLSLFSGHYEVSNSVSSECSVCLTTDPDIMAALAHGLEPLKL